MGRAGIMLTVAAIATGSFLMAATMADLAGGGARRLASASPAGSCDDRVFPYVASGCGPAGTVAATTVADVPIRVEQKVAAPSGASASRVEVASSVLSPVPVPVPSVPAAAESARTEILPAPSAASVLPPSRPVRTERTFEPITSVKAAEHVPAEPRDARVRTVRVIPIERNDTATGQAAIPTVPRPAEVVTSPPPVEAPAPQAVAAKAEAAPPATEPAREAVAVSSGQPSAAVGGVQAAAMALVPVTPAPPSGSVPAAREADDAAQPATRRGQSRRGYARADGDERGARSRREARAERRARRREYSEWGYPDGYDRGPRDGRRWASDAPPPGARYYYRPADRPGFLGFLGVN